MKIGRRVRDLQKLTYKSRFPDSTIWGAVGKGKIEKKMTYF